MAVAMAVLVAAVMALGRLGQDGPLLTAEPASKAAGVARSEARPKAPGDLLVAFRGLSTWIDTYDVDLTAQQQVDLAADAGVNAIFVQSSRQSTEGLIHD
ncbi:MAG TPA: hypothetical protein VMM13_12330, partial [Euzebya sp.]|nr:hypothetical protein [Euzebya sp.]